MRKHELKKNNKLEAKADEGEVEGTMELTAEFAGERFQTAEHGGDLIDFDDRLVRERFYWANEKICTEFD